MVVSIDGGANLLAVTSLAVSIASGVMILSCVTCKCWRRFMKKELSVDEENPDEVYTNPSFDDAPQKTTVETKRKKIGSAVVTNSPNNSIEPYQEVAEGVVLQNRFTNDKKENVKTLNEFNVKNTSGLKGGKFPEDKVDTEQISQSELSNSSNTASMPADAVSNSSTIVVSVEVHCTGVENGHIGVSPPVSNNCSPKQKSILEDLAVDNDLECSLEKNGVAIHINQFAVERLKGNMKNTQSLQNTSMSIAL